MSTSIVLETIGGTFQPQIARAIFLVKTEKFSYRFCHLTIFLVVFFQNQSDQYVNDYGNNQRYSPAIYTHCYDTSGTRLFAAGGPLQIGLKGNYLSLFQWRNLELHYMSFLFLFKKKKHLLLNKTKTKNCSYKTAIYTHCYNTSGTRLVDPCKLDFKEIICLYFSDGTWNLRFFCSFSKT